MAPLLQVQFNPRIKTYVFLTTALALFFSILGIPILIFWLFGLGQYYGRRYYNSLKCELTDRHLRFRKGVLFIVEKTIPLENIQDITFLDNPFLRWFDLRILKIETAGHSSTSGSDMKLIGIMDTENFKERVLKQRELLVKEGKSESLASSSGSDDILAILRKISQQIEAIHAKMDQAS